jgi:hypothetical protein
VGGGEVAFALVSQREFFMQIEFIGVYPVHAIEPCHLVELWVRELADKLLMADFTQESEGQPRDNWQVPYDERVLDEDGTAQVGERFPQSIVSNGNDLRLAFFFHFLDFSKPLLTPIGPMKLPTETRLPNRLEFFVYESPC